MEINNPVNTSACGNSWQTGHFNPLFEPPVGSWVVVLSTNSNRNIIHSTWYFQAWYVLVGVYGT